MGGRFRPVAGCSRRRGLSRPWDYEWKIMGIWMVWFGGVSGVKPLEEQVKWWKTRTPPASGAGGVRKETDDGFGS
jgi:hypothetical protein